MGSWKIENVPSQKGRIVIITGANSGIGYEAALQLAKMDATVVMGCRNMESAEKARQKMLDIYPEANLTTMEIDLSSLKSVREFADEFRKTYTKLDLLINNAGIMMSPYKETADGFENQLATNFIGHFALTGLLMQNLVNTPGSRVINLSSLAHKWAPINFDDLHSKEAYSKTKAYGQSKRACLVFSYELNRRLTEADKNTIALAAHPGLSNTNLDRYFPAFIRPIGNLFLQNAADGALPTLYAALNKELGGGEYIGPDGFQEFRGSPEIVDSSKATKKRGMARKLWEEAEKMTGVYYNFEKMADNIETAKSPHVD